MDKILEYSKKVILEKIKKEDTCIDMTCGRGNDTIFLANNCKKVYAFDIQKEAILSTKGKTKDCNNVIIIEDSHESVDKYVNEEVGIVIYNLGYLPKGDHNITTHYSSVISSIYKVLKLLREGGLIAITVYPGHEEGKNESINLDFQLREFNQKEYEVLKYEFINQANNPPYLYLIEKIGVI